MADHYSKFATALKCDPETADEEFKWLKLQARRLADGKAVFGYSGGSGWKTERHPIDANTIFLTSDDSFDQEGLAVVLMNYLKKFNEETVLKVEWANTCSKSRPDEFGGGAMVISCDGFELFHTSQWAMQKQSEWQELLTGNDLGFDDVIDLEDDEEF